jgi:hypothetical protein
MASSRTNRSFQNTGAAYHIGKQWQTNAIGEGAATTVTTRIQSHDEGEKQQACDVQCNVCLTRTRVLVSGNYTLADREWTCTWGTREYERENWRSEAHLAIRTAATRSRSVNHARTFHSWSAICHQTTKQSSQPSWTLEHVKWFVRYTEKSLTRLTIYSIRSCAGFMQSSLTKAFSLGPIKMSHRWIRLLPCVRTPKYSSYIRLLTLMLCNMIIYKRSAQIFKNLTVASQFQALN